MISTSSLIKDDRESSITAEMSNRSTESDIVSQLDYETVYSETNSISTDSNSISSDLVNNHDDNNNDNKCCCHNKCKNINRSCIVFVSLIFTGVIVFILSKYAKI